jgi:anti-anti-sigma factor
MAFDPTGFSISISERNGRAVVVLWGELDLATAPDLDTALTELQEAGQDVAVDLRELAFMDSTGLRALVAAHARVEDAEQSFVIVRPRPGGPIERILAIAGVASVLEVVDDA